MSCFFNDALDLKFAVSDHVGSRAFSDVWPRLVQQAETGLNHRLRTVWQIVDDKLEFSDGEALLPPDFLEMLHVYGSGGQIIRPGSSASTYSIGPGKIFIRGFSGERGIQYYAALPTISSSLSASNWLLEKYPEAYLYAVGLQAAKFLKDVELSQATDLLLSSALQSIKIDDDRARWSGSVVRVQGMTP